ncbi:Helitron helicase-like domain at N-terminus [Phytophthora infestans]|uniref:Helitron helicase-like domain at N-terminus n=1 Tax=Phytophthora infestans TaxID=4787 RepID=A0A8S9TQB9_PHYIN|nr:Helitron helicase-like domain at N-terminus [Phytophthora infestans]
MEKRTSERGAKYLSGGLLKELACCVCDCMHPAARVKVEKVDSGTYLLQSMKTRLKPPKPLPSELRTYYDMSGLSAELAGILLARSGIVVKDEQLTMQVCTSCRTSLLDRKRGHPPKFAVANGLFMGCLPMCFSDSTFTENAMLNLSQPMHFISVVRGGKHSSIRSHAYFFRADPAPPAETLPRDVFSEGVVGVTMVGATTTDQKAATLKKYDVRARLREQLDWYKANNHLYKSVEVKPEWETTIVTIRTRVVLDQAGDGNREHISSSNDQTSDERLNPPAGSRTGIQSLYRGTDGSGKLDRATWRHNAPAPAHESVSEEDEMCEQTADGWISDFRHIDVPTGVQLASNNSRVVVYRSSSILSDFDSAFWTNSFSELFPYGRGGLEESRAIPISLLEFIRFCLRHSSRRFVQHRSLRLMHNALHTISIRARMLPGSMERSASVSREDLQNYVQYQQSRLKAIADQLPIPPAPEINRSVRELYNNISTGMRSYWGASSFQMANLAGGIADDVFEEMQAGVYECLEFTRAKLGSIATANPAICARHFDRLMDIFIDVVLNRDSDQGCSQKDSGLFGHTKSFYAATESQNSTGSLHSHMLIWIENMPSTVDEYYTMCSSEGFRC